LLTPALPDLDRHSHSAETWVARAFHPDRWTPDLEEWMARVRAQKRRVSAVVSRDELLGSLEADRR
jgi:hypothetical protein